MHRFFASEAGRNEVVNLPEAEANHATRVLRLPTGTVVTLLDGAGGEFQGILEYTRRSPVTVRIHSRLTHPRPATEITLIQGVAKGPAMEGLIHRAVELGGRRLIPLVADRSVSRPDAPADKRAKWQSLALEAAKQSGNPWQLDIEPLQSPSNSSAYLERFELTLIASLLDSPCHPRVHFDAFQLAHGRPPRTVAVVVGPEGDFTDAEYAAFKAAGALSFSLGPHVLRVETAATAAIAIVQSLLAERQLDRT